MAVTIRPYRKKDRWKVDKGFRTRFVSAQVQVEQPKMEPSEIGSVARIFGTHLGISFGLAAAAAVGVVVRAFVSVFVNSVQKPEQELEGIVLRVPPKLRGVPCHRALRRGETSTFILGCFQ